METPFWPATPDNDSPTVAAKDQEQTEPEVNQLLKTKISQPVVEYLVDRVSEAVDYGFGRPSTSVNRILRTANHDRLKLVEFFGKVLKRAEVTMSVVLGTLIYIDRARPHLRIAIEEWAHHRVFLGALILASKYLNDSSLKNVHWALCTGVFGRRDVARIEREFLEVLDFELGVKPRHLNREFWNLVDARVVNIPTVSRKSSASSGLNVGLGALNLIEFGAAPKMVREGGVVKRKAMDMAFGEDMDVEMERKLRLGEEMQRGRRERRDALELYAPTFSMQSYRGPAPSPITPLSARSDSPASSCSPGLCMGSCASSSDSDTSSPSASSDSDESAVDPCTPALYFPLPQPLSVPRVDALRCHSRSRSYSPSKLTLPSKIASAFDPLRLPHPKPIPTQVLPALPSAARPVVPPLAVSRSLPPSRGSSRSASPYSALPLSRTGSAMALYPSCLTAASHPPVNAPSRLVIPAAF